jgi:Ca2+/Na+ antiporter
MQNTLKPEDNLTFELIDKVKTYTDAINHHYHKNSMFMIIASLALVSFAIVGVIYFFNWWLFAVVLFVLTMNAFYFIMIFKQKASIKKELDNCEMSWTLKDNLLETAKTTQDGQTAIGQLLYSEVIKMNLKKDILRIYFQNKNMFIAFNLNGLHTISKLDFIKLLELKINKKVIQK